MVEYTLDNYISHFVNKQELLIYTGNVDTNLSNSNTPQMNDVSWAFNLKTNTFAYTNWVSNDDEVEITYYGNILEFTDKQVKCQMRFYKDKNVDHELYYKGFDEEDTRTEFTLELEDNKLITDLKGKIEVYLKQ